MIGRRGLKCRSSRVRRGYKETTLLLRAIGIYSFLCDNCNLLFKGFALPGRCPQGAANGGASATRKGPGASYLSRENTEKNLNSQGSRLAPRIN